jgi:hypothetical protein
MSTYPNKIMIKGIVAVVIAYFYGCASGFNGIKEKN